MSSLTEFAPSPVPSPLVFQTIIFATDLSGCSEKAGRYAVLMARRFDADLIVAHAYVLSQAAMEVEIELQGIKHSVQRAELETAVAQEAQKLGRGLRSSIPVLFEGDPHEQIPQLACRHEPSLIVLGTQGRGRLERALLGSVSEQILRSASGPTLTVGPHVCSGGDGDPPIRRVLYATGLSSAAARGAAYAMGIAETFQAEIEVMHVIHPEDVEKAGSLTEVQQRFEAELASILPQHAGRIAEPRGVVATGTAHTRILEHIHDNKIDLLVLSLRRSSHLWLQSRLSGAFHIIANATCPVLTIVG